MMTVATWMNDIEQLSKMDHSNLLFLHLVEKIHLDFRHDHQKQLQDTVL